MRRSRAAARLRHDPEPGVLPALSTSCTAKPIRFGVQQRVEGLLDRPTNHLVKIIPDPGFINLDDLTHRLQSIVFTYCFDPSSVRGSQQS
jgi:hypothetical protein